MIDPKLIELLKLFNLTEYESKTYLALVARGSATVKEIREFSGIPYSREYDILSNLEKRGFVQVQPGRPKKFKAVEPGSVLKKELEVRANAIEKLIASLSPLYESTSSAETFEDVVWMVKGEENIREKLVEMLRSAKKQILILGVKPVTTPEIEAALKEVSSRGVKIRALGIFDSSTKAAFKDISVQYLDYAHDHSRFVLIDDRELILASEDPANFFFALYNKNPGCIKLYQNFFEHIWQDVKAGKEKVLKQAI